MGIEIDWGEIGRAIQPSVAGSEPAGGDVARRALEMILGEDTMREGVDWYVDRRPGSELVRSVLWLLRPWSAMAHCHEIAASSSDIEERRSAVELLRVVADRRALPWVSEYLADPDSKIQVWGIGILDQLLWSDLIEPAEGEETIERAAHHENSVVRERAEFIRSYLRDRKDRDQSDRS